MARTRRLKDLAAFIEKLKSSPRSPVLKPLQSPIALPVATIAEAALNGNNSKESKKAGSLKADGEKKDLKAGVLDVAGVVIDAAKQKEKEREKNVEKFYARMGELRDRMSEDKGAKKGKREESPKPEEKKEQRAGLLTIAPGVLTAARQKDKEKEKNLERYSKVRGEKRPEGKLVDTRTARTKTFKDRDKVKVSRSSVNSAASSAVNGARKLVDSTRSSPSQRQMTGIISGGKDDFPPLPGAREPHIPSATLNYAASALFNPSAPADMDPFDDDSTLESSFSGSVIEDDACFYYDEEAELDVFNRSDADTPPGKRDAPEDTNNWNYDPGNTGPVLASAKPLVTHLQPTNANASGVFLGLFSGSGTGSGGSFFSSMPDLVPLQDAKIAASFEDDDFADDVVVFRPAFSRINSGSSALPPPPMSYIGSAATPALQPYVLNGSSTGMGDLGGLNNQGRPLAYGTSLLTNPYQDGYGAALGTEPAWQTRERMMTSSVSNAADSNTFNRIPTRPVAFNDPLGFSAQSNQPHDNHHPDTTLTTEEKWWVSGQSSDVQLLHPGLSNRQNNPLEESNYVGTKGPRGPPALQHVSSGWSIVPPYREQLTYSAPLHPPGFVPPPPGFTVPTTGSCAQPTQVQHGAGNTASDSWTSNPFYRSSG